jgi:hypothetical protein
MKGEDWVAGYKKQIMLQIILSKVDKQEAFDLLKEIIGECVVNIQLYYAYRGLLIKMELLKPRIKHLP